MLSCKSHHRHHVREQAWLYPGFIHKNRCQARIGCRHNWSQSWTKVAWGHTEGTVKWLGYSLVKIPSSPHPLSLARIRSSFWPVLLSEGEEKYYFKDFTNSLVTHCPVGSAPTDDAQAYSCVSTTISLPPWWLLVKAPEPDSRVWALAVHLLAVWTF